MKVIEFAPFFVSQQLRCYSCPARLSPAVSGSGSLCGGSLCHCNPQERSAQQFPVVWLQQLEKEGGELEHMRRSREQSP